MAKVKTTTYKGQRIFLADHSGLQGEQVVQNQKRMVDLVVGEGTKEALSLIDMRGVPTDPGVDRGLRQQGQRLKRYSKKAAVVGRYSGARAVVKNALMKLVGMPMRLFDDVEAAKEWLVE